MPRYFIELSYKGTNYSGFQVQENAKTIQGELTAALTTIYRRSFELTGSSRTDAGVHAVQNFFHFDTDLRLQAKEIYNLNAVLPPDIAVRGYYKVAEDAHCRFGALSREYKYFIYNTKQPFLYDRGWYYPYRVDRARLEQAAAMVLVNNDFGAFAKRNSQVRNFNCMLTVSKWEFNDEDRLVYHVKANRFLRGMVRALVSSMLKLARGSMTLEAFQHLLNQGEPSSADFSAPPQGLFLDRVEFPAGYLEKLT